MADAPAEVAATAVGDIGAPEQLGRAYAWVSGCQMAGFIAGPAIGGLLAVVGRWAVFATTGAALLIAAAGVAGTLRWSVHSATALKVGKPLNILGRTRSESAVRAIATASIGLGLLIGIYDVIWSLFMRSLNATDIVIGISFDDFVTSYFVSGVDLEPL